MITGYVLLTTFSIITCLVYAWCKPELRKFTQVWLKGYLKALVFILGVGVGAAVLTLGVMMFAQELNPEWSARVFEGFDLREAAGEVTTELAMVTLYLYTHYAVLQHFKKK